ncbi:Kdo hydroxylase family protein [Enterobacter sp. Lyrl_3]|uniref:Kdo hydroxylase family protein n=1 Tax=Enterobacter sp. Lyrl_3 TaxID=3110922 RepID=UPI003F81598C
MIRSTPVSITTLPFTDLNMPETDFAVQDPLEEGNVLYLPETTFPLNNEERNLLTTALVSPRRKNISYQPEQQKISGMANASHVNAVRQLTERYYRFTVRLLNTLLPGYRDALFQPQTSLRLYPVTAWRDATSWRKDDTRLHVDAIPSRPVHGNRILRVFCNINQNGEPRIWRTGEHFDSLAACFLPSLAPWYPLVSTLQAALGITKSRRSHYDHLMLELHNRMKSDDDYQLRGVQQVTEFAAGSMWICFSDQTPHAAVSGQFMLEQTFLLPVTAMRSPQYSPLHILEKFTGESLT